MHDNFKFELTEDLEQILSEVLQEQESGKSEDHEELIQTVMEVTLDESSGNTTEETTEAAPPQPQEQPVKRKRGRPRKSEVATSQSKPIAKNKKEAVPKMRLAKSIKILAYKIWTGAIPANTPVKSLKNKELQAIKYLHSNGYLRIEDGRLTLSKEFLAILLGIKIKDEHTIGALLAQ
ncbi:MAG: hypothetical protein QW255_05020 [Candidatus Bilamarchaeaceae archaeon]